jgi:probable phosphoglycerate mutase
MAELKARVVHHIEELGTTSAGTVIVTHAEAIRVAILHYRNMSLDRFSEIEIAPGSVSTLKLHSGSVDTVEVNRPVTP